MKPLSRSERKAAETKAQQHLPDLEKFLAVLREEGCSPGESAIACNTVAGLSPEEAKAAVIFSKTWAFQKEATLALHDQLEAMTRTEAS